MSTIIADDLWVCTDCAMMIANGELGQGDWDAEVAHCQRMNEHLSERLADHGYGSWVLGDEGLDFSSCRCDGCGSNLAGYRNSAAVLS